MPLCIAAIPRERECSRIDQGLRVRLDLPATVGNLQLPDRAYVRRRSPYELASVIVTATDRHPMTDPERQRRVTIDGHIGCVFVNGTEDAPDQHLAAILTGGADIHGGRHTEPNRPRAGSLR